MGKWDNGYLTIIDVKMNGAEIAIKFENGDTVNISRHQL